MYRIKVDEWFLHTNENSCITPYRLFDCDRKDLFFDSNATRERISVIGFSLLFG
jgi:hypothetical protein